eukprot:gene5969-11329_t
MTSNKRDSGREVINPLTLEMKDKLEEMARHDEAENDQLETTRILQRRQDVGALRGKRPSTAGRGGGVSAQTFTVPNP